MQYIKLRLTAKYIVLSHYYHCSTATLPSPPLPQSLPHRTTVATPAAVLQCLIRGVPPAMQRHYSRGKSARKMTLILYRRSNEEKQRNQQTPEALYRHPASRLVSLRPRFASPLVSPNASFCAVPGIFRWNFDKKYATLLFVVVVRPRRIIQVVPR